jgi:FkbM family methyltransferase
MVLFVRFFYFFYRVFNTIRFLGVINTYKIFLASKYTKKNMSLTLFNNQFTFRPKIDKGSYNRLTKSQYILKGTNEQPIEIIIDAGANIGSQAIRFANLNPKLKKIICIEPDIENSKLCEQNLKNYNAIIFNNALSSDTYDKIFIQNNDNSEMSEIIRASASNEIKRFNNVDVIKTISINEIVKIEELNKIDFIKFDINGYEDNVFSKNLEWIKITESIAFNNADINNIACQIINEFQKVHNKIKIFNIDQMIFLIKDNKNWEPIKGFMNSKKIGFIERDNRY